MPLPEIPKFQFDAPTTQPQADAGQEGSVGPERVVRDKYDPRDTNRDGVVDEIERYQSFLQQTPEERRADWVQENVLSRGLSADYETGEIVDSQGRVVGQLPLFD